jgi:hypothetical protein
MEIGEVTSDSSELTKTPGGIMFGGNRIHNFDPVMTAFHALVAFGSFD